MERKFSDLTSKWQSHLEDRRDSGHRPAEVAQRGHSSLVHLASDDTFQVSICSEAAQSVRFIETEM